MHSIYLLIRKTTAWQDESAFHAQLSPAFAPKVEVWNRTFRMPYHLFRHAIRGVAISNHDAMEGVLPATWDDIPDKAIVLPSDDDDWFSPDIASSISRSMAAHHDGVHWTQSVLEVPINRLHRVNLVARRVIPWVGPKWLCATNNYAFRKNSAANDCLAHTRASRQFASGRFDVALIPRRLSLHNRTLASITSLAFERPTISMAELRRKADQYRRLYGRPGLPAGLEWAAPQVRAMRDVMADLRTL